MASSSSSSTLPTLSASSLSSSSTKEIETPVAPGTYKPTAPDDLDAVYDIPGTIAHLGRVVPPAKSVSLQFPDHLLIDSVEVFRRIQKGLDGFGHGGKAFVLADTTYGSCCVDALSALHICSDFLVHYGHACLTRSSDPALRLRYVFPSLPLSIPSTIDAVLSLASSSTEPEDRDKGVVVMYDVGYYWAVGELEAALKERRRLEKGKGREVIFSKIELDEQEVPVEVGAEAIKIKKSDATSAPEVALWPVTKEKAGESSTTTTTPTARPHTCTCDKPKGGPSCSGSVDLASTPTCTRVTSLATANPTPHPTSLPPSSSGESHKTTSLRSYSLPSDKTISDYLLFYIGDGDSLQIRNILVTHSRNQVFSYTPSTSPSDPPPQPILQSFRTNRLLMRRYAVMQKARDADVLGLLVGNVNLANSLPLLTRLRTLLREAHKKTYTLSVGKLNPAKLANFAEIECFVLIACGENSLVDSKDFLQPIITPFELELALQPSPEWTGDYVLDFTRLLEIVATEEESDHAEPELTEVEDASLPPKATETSSPTGDLPEEFDMEDPLNQPVFSTVTGTYRHPKRFGAPTSDLLNSTKSLSLRSTESQITKHTHITNPSELFKARSWVGLDPRIGLDKVSALEEGRGGRAWGYEGEGERREKGKDDEDED
ncbi:putative diphthamide synthesis protein-domain-containing protein [Mrakia frigida]|uniref:2-(3-amino-3-carboxypropyl)histidine synthase n=1 Tax=Mrakia frigida TaxID=29902 RepID=UPI003FCC1D82